MGKRRAVIIIFSLILVLGAVTLFFIKNVKYADPQPAIKFGQRFYNSLANNNVKDAFALYSRKFQNAQGEKWENFLFQFNAKFGAVGSSELNGAKMVPIESNPCFALEYNVHRISLSTLEQIIVCPTGDKQMSIVGHGLTRLDTNQKIKAGISFNEVGIRFP